MSCVVFKMVIFQIHDCWKKKYILNYLNRCHIGGIIIRPIPLKKPTGGYIPFFWKLSKNGFQLFKLSEITTLNWNVL